MEPGHEDREYELVTLAARVSDVASMEPGHEDREYTSASAPYRASPHASMEPGHEDREYTPPHRTCTRPPPGLNGARS